MSELDFLVGQTVSELRYSVPGNLRIVFDEGDRVEPALYADLGPFRFLDGGDRHDVDPEDPNSVGPALRMVGRQVQAVDSQSGSLTLTFSDGSRVRCEPHDDYEAWQVASPLRLIASTPGGEVAVSEPGPE